MTGEMHQSEVTREAYPIHFAVADTVGGTVHAFDVYQGPYILVPFRQSHMHRVWVIGEYGDHAVCRLYDEVNDKQSPRFWHSDLERAADLIRDRRPWRKVKR